MVPRKRVALHAPDQLAYEESHRPSVGDVLYFRYPCSLQFKHRMYDNFPPPDGRLVRSSECFVWLRDPLVVEVVEVAWWNEAEYIGVQFAAPCGRLLWTNYSMNGHRWLVGDGLNAIPDGNRKRRRTT